MPAPGAALLLVVTGNLFGSEVNQVTELVTSLTSGVRVEKVPIARNCPLWPKVPKTIPLGMMVSERMLSPTPYDPPVPVFPVEPGTVRTTLELTGPLYPDALATIDVVPPLTAVTRPVELTVATAGMLELQVTEFVMFCVEGWLELP